MKAVLRAEKAAAVCLALLFVLLAGALRAAAHTAIEAEIPVSCLRFSDDGRHTYTIRIESEKAAAPAPSSDTLVIGEDGQAAFSITVTEPGTFVYRIYEEAGDDPDIEYDKNIYNASVFAESGEDGQLTYSVVAGIEGKDIKADSITFEGRELGSSVSAPDSSEEGSEPESEAPVTDSTGNPITGFIGNIITGGSVSAHVVRIGFISIIAITASAILSRHERREEDEQDE